MSIFAKKHTDKGELYVVTGRQRTPLAKALLFGDPNADRWEAQLLGDSNVNAIVAEGTVQLIRLNETMYTIVGRVTGRSEDRIFLERVHGRDEDARRDLRVPIPYETYIYSAQNEWSGRCLVHCRDLSCGGIAFSCNMQLAVGEKLEIVVRMTGGPLVVKCQVLRTLPARDGLHGYAAKFIDLCHDEESILCKEVFGVQLRAAFNDKRNSR